MDSRGALTPRVVVVGAGGTIGSHLVPHLARSGSVRHLVLIDRDRYDAGNLANQNITRSEVGRPKARVQAARARRIAPDLVITAVVADVERLPLGLLHADLILGCVDNRRARLRLNEAAWRLGVTWIDAGVLADGGLARVSIYAPGADAACLECAWSEQDYRLVEQDYPCRPATAAATGTPSGIGALAGALLATEADQHLRGAAERLPAGSEVVVSAHFHRHYLTRGVRRSECRFDHRTWPVELEPGAPTRELGQLIRSAGFDLTRTRVTVPGHHFARRLECPGCGRSHPVARLASRLGAARKRCPHCAAERVLSGFAMSDALGPGIDGALARRSLAGLGLTIGDLIHLSDGARERYLELAPTDGDPTG
ncbi:MAG: ThiF family adenylyltransferase [Gemmatimonadales bacterium]